jgi:hypothetical protein
MYVLGNCCAGNCTNEDKSGVPKEFCSPFETHRCEISLNLYIGADKSLARPTSLCILLDGENISFDASLLYINNTNIPPIMIINRIHEHQNLL